MKYFEKIMDVLRQAESLGVKVLPDGTKLVGHVPHIGPSAYLHVIFRALNSGEISLLEKSINNELPPALKAFYSDMNGINLFSTTLSIHGLRKNYNRAGYSMWQPFGMEEINVSERIIGANKNLVFFASYKIDGSLLYTSTENEKVYKCLSTCVEPIYEWPNFQEAICQEVLRISEEFDKDGKKIV
jgi:hypothetical protein